MENEFKRFFEVDVSYIDAIEKKRKETFIVKAISFAEAEDKAYLYFKDYSVGDVDVLSVKISNVTEVILDEEEHEKYYKVKYSVIVVDEKSGKEKRTTRYLLFNASSIDEVCEMYKRETAGWVSDIIHESSITETKITSYLK